MTVICPHVSTHMAQDVFALIFIACFIGSIPFGLILTRLFTKQDITKIGSGNIGATNVLRTGNKKLAALTLFFDSVKGAVIVFAAPYIVQLQPFMNLPEHCKSTTPAQFEVLPTAGLLFGFIAILGHCYPVWLKFKGGKGVATTLGVLLAAVPVTGFLACLTWLVSAMAARISSLAAISAMLLAPAYTYTFYGLYPALVNALISALVIWRHKENIKRLRAGTEPRIGGKK